MRHEKRLVGYCCGLFAGRSNRECKRLFQRCGVGWRRWTYGPPYIPRYFWRVRGWAVRPSFVHQWKKTHPDGSMNEFVSDNKDYLPKGWEERLTSIGDTTDLKPGSGGGGSKSSK